MVFNFPKEANGWVETKHPGCSLSIYDNSDGTVSAILELPNDKEKDKDEANDDQDDTCSQCGEEPCFMMVEKKENFEELVVMYRYDGTLNNTQ